MVSDMVALEKPCTVSFRDPGHEDNKPLEGSEDQTIPQNERTETVCLDDQSHPSSVQNSVSTNSKPDIAVATLREPMRLQSR